MMNNLNGYLDGVFTLLSPLSHIGESHGVDSYLATQDIIGANGETTEVFVYSGNALRGMFRDCGSKYFLDNLSPEKRLQIPLDLFYLLFSGGSIGGNQKIDIDKAREIRAKMPVASIFGGGVGNQILAGKMCVNDGVPICSETVHMIPQQYLQKDIHYSWKQMTTERSYTRTDDEKDERIRGYILPEGSESGKLFADPSKKPTKTEEPMQMRYTVEVLQAGAKLYSRIDVRDMTPIEFGALTSAIYQWSKSPYIGGKANIGMGRCIIDYMWSPFGGKKELFMSLSADDKLELGTAATDTKQVYDDYLQQYCQYIADNKQQIVGVLNG